MLYWICPECGQECSPAIRECPTCTAPPAAQQTAASPAVTNNELLSLAQNFQSAPSVAVLAPPAPVQVDEPEPELSDKLASLDSLVAKPARPAWSEPAKLIPTPVPARISSPSAPLAPLPARTLASSPQAPCRLAQFIFNPRPVAAANPFNSLPNRCRRPVEPSLSCGLNCLSPNTVGWLSRIWLKWTISR